jgi:DNA transformation protein
MPRRSEFIEHVVETMRRFGPVEVRRMFGGWGFYHQGLFFALAADDILYFKSDDENRGDFDAHALPHFTFMKKGESVVTSYRQAPDDAFESAEVMAEWCRRGYAAALRAAARKRPRKARG